MVLSVNHAQLAVSLIHSRFARNAVLDFGHRALPRLRRFLAARVPCLFRNKNAIPGAEPVSSPRLVFGALHPQLPYGPNVRSPKFALLERKDGPVEISGAARQPGRIRGRQHLPGRALAIAAPPASG